MLKDNCKYFIWKSIVAILVGAAMVSCSDIVLDFNQSQDQDFNHTDSEVNDNKDASIRDFNQTQRRVFIYMALGFNNLSSYLGADIEEIISNPLPSGYWKDDVVLIFSHKTVKYADYGTRTSPTLTQVYRDWDGSVARDTLVVFDPETDSASAETISEVLTYVKENFPARSYGMLMSSHGTGWAPADYCTHPSVYEKNSSDGTIWQIQSRDRRTAKPFLLDLSVDGGPAVKGIGVQNRSSSQIIEMDITDLAEAIPMRMDYIIFDACFMGGVEVAYEFKDVCNRMVFSQTEILADGMDYNSMISYLFDSEEADLEGFCENYYQFYNQRSGEDQSATISLVDCTKLDALAETCRDVFSTRKDAIRALEGSSKVQKYFRSEYAQYHKWFFDLRDIVKESGATAHELEELDAALAECITFKASTRRFLSRPIDTHCGLSMYLPYKDRTYLNDFYKTLKWNEATGLVE